MKVVVNIGDGMVPSYNNKGFLFISHFKDSCKREQQVFILPITSMGLAYLPTFTIKKQLNYEMWVNIPVPWMVWVMSCQGVGSRCPLTYVATWRHRQGQ